MKTIRLFQTDTGIKPFYEWLMKVKDIKDRARIRRRIDRSSLGHYGDYKQLKKGLYELRLFFGAGYRVLLQKFILSKKDGFCVKIERFLCINSENFFNESGFSFVFDF